MSQENVEIVRRALDAFASEGPDGPFHLGLVYDEIEIQTAFGLTGENVYVGRGGWERFIKRWTTEAFDDYTVETEDLIDAGNVVVAWQRQRGRGKGSGVPVEGHFAMVLRLREGKIVRSEIYMNLAEALEAVGLSEQDARADS